MFFPARAALIASAILATGTVQAGWKIKKPEIHIHVPSIKQVIQTVAPIVAPGAVIGADIIAGKPVDKSVKGVIDSNIKVMVAPAEGQILADQFIEDSVKKALGPDASKAIEIIRLPQKLERRSYVEGMLELQHVIDTGQLGDIKGIELAAALHQAKDLYSSRKQPLPTTTVILMSGTYSQAVLWRARYVVDDNLGSLNAIINRLNESSGQNHAVVVDDTIVFAKMPDTDDVWFWGHEIQHTVQYSELGIEGFAAKYISHYKEMESEADGMGDKALHNAEAVRNYLVAKGQRGN